MATILKDEYESEKDFKRRKELTLKLIDLNFNQQTAIVSARMIINKEKLGVTYDKDIEKSLQAIQALL